jgi:tetratricopeptide (TPR) repeat protein
MNPLEETEKTPPGIPSTVLDARSAVATTPLVPDYELLRRIGGGSYGEVWLARSNATGVYRAAKIVWRHTFEDERPFQRECIQRFERISREHPSQLALFHIGRNDAEGYFYYVMELADGEEMQNEKCKVQNEKSRASASDAGEQSILNFEFSILNYHPHTLRADLAHGRLPASRVLELGLTLSEALSHLHRNGLVHRDVKPSNVIFVNGKPKLADIGLVTDASDTCSIVGTEGYLPPEGPGTPQADLFALGKVLYEAATGIDRREFPKLPEDLRAWPDANQVFELNEILLKACALNVRERYDSAENILVDLQRLGGGKSVRRARQVERGWRLARRGAVWLTATAAALALVVLASRVRQTPVFPREEKPSTNAVANYFYERGKTYFDKLRGTNFQMAVYFFEQATNADPNFAEAYARLADVHSWSDGEWNPGWKFFPQARAFARQALDLDKSLAEPHGVLACYDAMMEWDWKNAEKEAELAIKLNSSHNAYLSYAEVLRIMGRTNEALVEIDKALKLDSRSITLNHRLAGYLADARRFEDAPEQIDKALDLDSNLNVSDFRQDIFCAQGHYREAIELSWTSRQVHGESTEELERDLGALKRTPDTDLPKAYWRRKLEKAKKGHDSPYWEARAHTQLSETDEAIRCLQQACENHDTQLTFYVMTDWTLDPVRSDPRFHAILKKMHLE